jgi:N-hydroxyarylamine O-acetyltransferase
MSPDPAAYLARLAYTGRLVPDAQTLTDLQLAHLTAVPFENLDIHWRRPIQLGLPELYAKIVTQRRGGFCYELNGLFAWLLASLGFNVSLLSARVYGDNGPGPEFDHLTLLVQLEEPWLADVGFGDSFLQPLRFRLDEEQAQANGRYRLLADGADMTLWRRQPDQEWTLQEWTLQEWTPQYRFSTRPRQLSDFAAMCHYHQTSPNSSFTRRRVCSRVTPDGRITLTDSQLIVTHSGSRQETAVAGAAEFAALLRQQFGIQAPEQPEQSS